MLPSESIECPYCGEQIDLVIDDSIEHQQYVEDCSVCCRPINVDVSIANDAAIHIRCWTDTET